MERVFRFVWSIILWQAISWLEKFRCCGLVALYRLIIEWFAVSSPEWVYGVHLGIQAIEWLTRRNVEIDDEDEETCGQ